MTGYRSLSGCQRSKDWISSGGISLISALLMMSAIVLHSVFSMRMICLALASSAEVSQQIFSPSWIGSPSVYGWDTLCDSVLWGFSVWIPRAMPRRNHHMRLFQFYETKAYSSAWIVLRIPVFVFLLI